MPEGTLGQEMPECAHLDSNQGPPPYQGGALNQLSYARD